MADGKTCFQVYPRNHEGALKPILVAGTRFNWCTSECTLDIYDGEELVAAFHLRDVIGIAEAPAASMTTREYVGVPIFPGEYGGAISASKLKYGV